MNEHHSSTSFASNYPVVTKRTSISAPKACSHIAIALVLLFLALNSHSLMASPKPTIFVLHSYHQGYVWTDGQHQAFRDTLKTSPSGKLVQLYTEYLDSNRAQYDQHYRQLLLQYLKNRYQHLQPDLVYATDDNALRYWQKFGHQLFPDTPVIFSGVNDLSQRQNLSPNLNGVFEQVPIEQNLKLIQTISPDISQLFVVGDASITHNKILKQVVQLTRQILPKVEITEIAYKTKSDLIAKLKQQQQGTLLLTTVAGLIDDNDALVPIKEAIPQLAHSGSFHIFVTGDLFLSPGVIGGWVQSSQAHGEQAAKLAITLLNRDEKQATNVLPAERVEFNNPIEAVFNYQELKSQSIPTKVLPRNYRLFNEPNTLYYRYRQQTAWLVIAFATLIGIIALLSLNVRRRKQAELQLVASRMQIYRLFENAPDIILLTNTEGWILDLNQHAVDSLGYTRERLLEMRLTDLDPRATQDELDHLVSGLANGGDITIESSLKRQNGSKLPADIKVSSCLWNHESALLCFARDITERKRNERILQENQERLNQLAYHDNLTELPNRLLFQDRLGRAIKRGKRQKSALAVIFLDLDRFKNINDSLGHDVGDQVLTAVAERLQKLIRASDTIARLGGDEFVLLIEDIHDVTKLVPLLNKLKSSINKPVKLEQGEMFVTASLGVALYPKDTDSPQELMKYADVAMYQAKQQRNGYAFYHSDMDARATEFLFLESSLRRALEANQFIIEYQPQFELANGCLAAMEALIRWQHPDQGLVPPGDFIPLSEETGLIVPIGEWVITQACQQLRYWLDRGLAVVPIAVNISPRQFNQSNLIEQIREPIEKYDVDPGLIELEVTENSLMMDTEKAIETMEKIRDLGIKISIDDFGSGFSSMAYLKRFPINKLKIDRSFTSDLGQGETNAAIISAIVTLGQSLDLLVVAEGIENKEQRQLLNDLSCHLGQGYHLGKPISVAAATQLLEAHQHNLEPATD